MDQREGETEHIQDPLSFSLSSANPALQIARFNQCIVGIYISTYHSLHCCELEAENADAVGSECLPLIPAEALLQAEHSDNKVPPRAPLVSIVLAIVLEGLKVPFTA